MESIYLEETSTRDLWEGRKKLDEQDDVTRICNNNEGVEASNSRDTAYYFSSPPTVSSANSSIPPLIESPSRQKRGIPNSHAKDVPISSQNALVIRTTASKLIILNVQAYLIKIYVNPLSYRRASPPPQQAKTSSREILSTDVL
ncbi:hypothetical protein K449DRAFT_157420 [Hypoxylon sp. EC38]|nr:hypothetical protein K449DRAFT_157420 [Hypoxylon sp. EC38]